MENIEELGSIPVRQDPIKWYQELLIIHHTSERTVGYTPYSHCPVVSRA